MTTLPPGHQLIVCGAEELYILDASTPTPTKVWSWRAANRPELPEDMRNWETATPHFTREVVVTLPDNNGHDMMPVPGSSLFRLTAQNHTWLFDRETRSFQRHPELGEYPSVKSRRAGCRRRRRRRRGARHADER